MEEWENKLRASVEGKIDILQVPYPRRIWDKTVEAIGQSATVAICTGALYFLCYVYEWLHLQYYELPSSTARYPLSIILNAGVHIVAWSLIYSTTVWIVSSLYETIKGSYSTMRSALAIAFLVSIIAITCLIFYPITGIYSLALPIVSIGQYQLFRPLVFYKLKKCYKSINPRDLWDFILNNAHDNSTQENEAIPQFFKKYGSDGFGIIQTLEELTFKFYGLLWLLVVSVGVCSGYIEASVKSHYLVPRAMGGWAVVRIYEDEALLITTDNSKGQSPYFKYAPLKELGSLQERHVNIWIE